MSLSTIHRVIAYSVLGIFFCLSFLHTHHTLGNPSHSTFLFALIMFGSPLAVIAYNVKFNRRFDKLENIKKTVPKLKSDVIVFIQDRFELQKIMLKGILSSSDTKAEIVSVGCFKRPVSSFILWNEDYYKNHTQEEQMAVGMHELGHAIEYDHCTRLPAFSVFAAISIGFGLFIYLDAAILLDHPQNILFVMNVYFSKYIIKNIFVFILNFILFLIFYERLFRWVLQPREHNADEWAVKLMGRPQPILSWLQRAADQEVKTNWLSDRLNEHPPVKERIAHIERYWRNRESHETVK